ncbi:MAG: succinylglutamate desuccinylase/aspartoacylase family protein [Gammaproteobacteria bacterium]|nr:succinylglutamate desuccinylase/aspartoacylase family protein [Gammaproteobacteria bacterium]
MSSQNQELTIGGVTIPPGSRRQIEIPVAKLFDYTEITIPVEVVRGKEDGPTLFVSAAIHGDEINGVETIKRLLARKKLTRLKGTLIAVPIVNVFGFNNNTRYLPDRRDLNRCFPGSNTGSLAGQVARKFMDEVVSKCTHGVDLHTAAIHRTNLPQIRACLNNPDNKRLALAFGVPVVMDSNTKDGSLRQAAVDMGIAMLLYEGGEALRYEEPVIKTALNGILCVMQSIGMIEGERISMVQRKKEVFVAQSSHWIRAPHSGSLRIRKKLGSSVKKDELLGILSNPFGQEKIKVKAIKTGLVIGMTMMPLVNNGDALFHIATFEDSKAVKDRVDELDTIAEDELMS